MAMIAMCLSLGRAKTKAATAALAEASPRLLPRLLQVPDMYICPSVYLSVYLSICLSLYLHICSRLVSFHTRTCASCGGERLCPRAAVLCVDFAGFPRRLSAAGVSASWRICVVVYLCICSGFAHWLARGGTRKLLARGPASYQSLDGWHRAASGEPPCWWLECVAGVEGIACSRK